ncbi:MAG: hypothetical protein P8Z30_02930 [Acidobacteriota bacterium]
MRIHLSVVLSLLLLFGLVIPTGAQTFPKPPEISPRDFALMAWGQSPSDPHQLALMRQAGLNISGFCAPDQLDAVHAAGMACFVSDPRANAYKWTEMPDQAEVQQEIDSLVQEVRNHPAALGFFLYDEPDASLFPGLDKVESALRKAMPGALPYVNLLPNYGTAARMGAPAYEAYLQKFMKEVRPSLLSYDNYSLFNGEMLSRFFTNLETIRRAALEAGIPFWNVVLSNTHFSYMDPTSATLRLQAYSTIAYGGRGIEYFTYYSPNAGNFRLAPIDQFGHRTPTWYKLREVNSQIRELAPWLIKLHSMGVYHSAPLPEGAKPIAECGLVKKVLATTYQNPPVRPEYLIGEFRDAGGHPFLMIVNKSLKYSFRYGIELKDSKKHLLQVSPYTGELVQSGEESNWLAPGAGALFEIK